MKKKIENDVTNKKNINFVSSRVPGISIKYVTTFVPKKLTTLSNSRIMAQSRDCVYTITIMPMDNNNSMTVAADVISNNVVSYVNYLHGFHVVLWRTLCDIYK